MEAKSSLFPSVLNFCLSLTSLNAVTRGKSIGREPNLGMLRRVGKPKMLDWPPNNAVKEMQKHFKRRPLKRPLKWQEAVILDLKPTRSEGIWNSHVFYHNPYEASYLDLGHSFLLESYDCIWVIGVWSCFGLMIAFTEFTNWWCWEKIVDCDTLSDVMYLWLSAYLRMYHTIMVVFFLIIGDSDSICLYVLS